MTPTEMERRAATMPPEELRRRAARLGINLPRLAQQLAAAQAEMEPMDWIDGGQTSSHLARMLNAVLSAGRRC